MASKKIEITTTQAKQFNLMIEALRQIRKQRNSKRREKINVIWNVNDTERLSIFIQAIQEISGEALKNVKPIKI